MIGARDDTMSEGVPHDASAGEAPTPPPGEDVLHNVPAGGAPLLPPDFTASGLQDDRGWLKWAPELVLGVDLQDAGRPEFAAIVSKRLRDTHRLLRIHPDKATGDISPDRPTAAELCR